MANIVKGDTVMIRRGRDKGKRGTVKAVFPRAGAATVEGINVVKRHTKQGSQSQNMGGSAQTGGILEKEAPIPLSALMYVCVKCNTPSRVHFKDGANGRQRVCARCGEPARESSKGA